MLAGIEPFLPSASRSISQHGGAGFVSLQASGQTLASLVDAPANRPDMQKAIRRLMRPDDMLETFSELAVKEPDLMRLVQQVSVAALVNVQSVEAVDRELKLRAVAGN